ncbi:C3a anaphylatoxin chemotactic receptor-like [Megalops cyprinoides]|uniref:C3a anaphylatoxin chemotactic receptor-like n=1 Tax=Megalops cyprinoides TaxID=118141 RepID=UPI001863A29E|nr:C3a anaphylatoxin chemotactic receptor-like [Megalops cyprinoides]
MHLPSIIIYSLAFLLGTTGNGLVIYVTGFNMKKTVNAVWFLNLAVADFLFTAFLLFSIVNLYKEFDWPFGEFLCKLNTLVGALNMFASIFILTAISLDRCLATWVVVWAQNKRTPRKAEIICIIIWVAALVCSLPFPLFRVVKIYNTTNWRVCQYEFPNGLQTYKQLIIFRFVVCFLIPFLIIVGSYLAICVRIRSLHRERTFKSIRVILAVILAFFVCWLPFHVFQFLDLKSKLQPGSIPNEAVVNVGLTVSSSLAFFNSCLNPFLYVFMCKDFKNKFRKSFQAVLEGAFSEDFYYFRNSRRSQCSRSSLSTGMEHRNHTATSLV